MDADELRKTLKRLDAMSERCDHLIGRERSEKPLRPDVSYPRRRGQQLPVIASNYRPPAKPTIPPPIATGELTGNEMRISNGYSPRVPQHDDCDPDGMWANFESEFDDMVAGMR